jgi:hypothetical protein
MKSLKITAIITGLVLICNIAVANQTLSLKFFKFNFLKTTFSAWKAKEINKYKFLAPVFPKEIPAEEPLSTTFSFGSITNDKNESVETYSNLAPSFPKEIPEEEVYFYSFESESNNVTLAPTYDKEIRADEEIQILQNLYQGEYRSLAPVFPKEIFVE